MQQFAAIIAMGLVLAACGAKNEDEGKSITINQDGQSATVRIDDSGGDSGIAPPANLPGFVPVYPGSSITSAVTGNEGEAKGMMTFTTADKQGQVLDFYKGRGKAAGLKVTAEMAMGESRMVTMGKEGNSDVAAQITASPAEDGKTTIMIIYSDVAAPAS